MAYELHIEGNSGPLNLEQWLAVVSEAQGVRACFTDITLSTAAEGVLKIPAKQGDVEVYFPDAQSWRAVFRWLNGRVSFRASFEPGDLTNPVWRAATHLAARLNARIRGDDGETYDLGTGSVI